MTFDLNCPVEFSRAETRRKQILSAAAICFRQHGFHGTSIAQISKEAGMSTGHIYHYFENKEAIIAGIVAQDLAQLLVMTSALCAASDVKAALLDRVIEGVKNSLDPNTAGLQLEIMAEAARNDRIAHIVYAADVHSRESLAATIHLVRQAAGHHDSESTQSGMVEALAAMFEGLRIRAIRNPVIDQDEVARIFTRMIDHLLTTHLD
jgi:AcrR family transcriptional regulator